jgi:menaquinone-dependent protoporphyrinogen oxidase
MAATPPRPRVLVAYASKHGHTRLVAERIVAVLRRHSLVAEPVDLGERGANPWPPDYAAVVVAASVHGSRHQKSVVSWARGHATTLGLRPSAFVSVSLTAADDTDEARSATRELIDELADETGWTPDVTLAVAGALQYREYDLPTRVLMRLIARQHGILTDTARDIVFTDWPAVERFAADVAATVAGQPGGVREAPGAGAR